MSRIGTQSRLLPTKLKCYGCSIRLFQRYEPVYLEHSYLTVDLDCYMCYGMGVLPIPHTELGIK